jgi:hypothetical protein
MSLLGSGLIASMVRFVSRGKLLSPLPEAYRKQTAVKSGTLQMLSEILRLQISHDIKQLNRTGKQWKF